MEMGQNQGTFRTKKLKAPGKGIETKTTQAKDTDANEKTRTQRNQEKEKERDSRLRQLDDLPSLNTTIIETEVKPISKKGNFFGMKKKPKRIPTWNVRSVLEASKVAEIAKEMKRFKIEVMGLCETRWPNSGEITTSNGNLLLYSGKYERESKN